MMQNIPKNQIPLKGLINRVEDGIPRTEFDSNLDPDANCVKTEIKLPITLKHTVIVLSKPATSYLILRNVNTSTIKLCIFVLEITILIMIVCNVWYIEFTIVRE